MRRRERAGTERATVVADTAQRLAVLLGAGLAPNRAWAYIGDVDGGAAQDIARRIGDGARATDAIAAQGRDWAPIARAWQVAAAVGAPLAETLHAIAASVRDAAEASDDVEIALAEPAMTARIMAWLPLAGVLLGFALGFDTLSVLTTQPIGVACALLGLSLMAIARWWTTRLVRRARDLPRAPGLRQELTAIALSGGASIPRALAIVGDADPDGDDAATSRMLELSRLAGVPAASLLRQDGADERRRVRTDARVRAARLGGRLLLPLGVCTLPAFFLLGVAPMLLSVITSATSGGVSP